MEDRFRQGRVAECLRRVTYEPRVTVALQLAQQFPWLAGKLMTDLEIDGNLNLHQLLRSPKERAEQFDAPDSMQSDVSDK